MRDGERRALVFTNLCNGLPVDAVMMALHLSEAEVMADFAFVAAKLRSYRFMRLLPPLDFSDIEKARANRQTALYTLSKLNLEKPAELSSVVTVPYSPTGMGHSEAEQIMASIMARRERAS